MTPSPTAVTSASSQQDKPKSDEKMSDKGSQEKFLEDIFVDDDSELIVNETAADEASRDGVSDAFDVGTMDKLSQDPPTPKKKSRKSATPKKVDIDGSSAPATPSKKAQLQAMKEKKEAEEKKALEEAQAFANGMESSDLPLGDDQDESADTEADAPATRPQEEKKSEAKKVSKVVKRRPGLGKKKPGLVSKGKSTGDGKEKATKVKGDGVSDEFSGLSLTDLKVACKERGLPVTGNKTALLSHLRGTSDAAKKKNSPKKAASKPKPKAIKAKGESKSPKKMKAKSPKTPVSKKRKAEGASPEAPAAKKQRRSPAPKSSVKSAKKKSSRPTLVLSGLDFDMKDIATSMCKDLGTYSYSDEVTDNCQLLVVGSKDSRTIKLFLAICNGATIVKHNWLMDSIEEGRWKDPGMYEAVDWFPGCRTAREIRKQKGLELLQGEDVHVEKPYLPIAVLGELILRLGGQVAPLRKATLCLSRTKVPASLNEKNIPVVTERWLIDSLLAYKLQDKANYAPEEEAEEGEPSGVDDLADLEESDSESDDEFDAAAADDGDDDDDDDEEMEDAEEDDA